MKFILFLRFNALKLMPQCKTSIKCASTLAKQEESTSSRQCPKNKNRIFIDFKSKEHFKKLLDSKESCSVCAVVIPVCDVAWAKISVPDLVLHNWDSYLLPENFLKIRKETNIANLANVIKQNIPNADSYIMESKTPYKASINELNFRAMLMLLLNSDKDALVDDKVFIQHTSVLNNTHNLLFYNERKPTKPIVSNILKLMESKLTENCSDHDYPDWYSKLTIDENHRQCFWKSHRNKQESLSLALLVALSFLKKNYFEAQSYTE